MRVAVMKYAVFILAGLLTGILSNHVISVTLGSLIIAPLAAYFFSSCGFALAFSLTFLCLMIYQVTFVFAAWFFHE